MKKIFFFLLICSFAKSQSSFKWSHFDDTVFERAKKEHKPVLLHLRANWCHWCHVMEEKTYADRTVQEYLQKNYIACMEDHDERQDLTSLYNNYGWPATIIFDENGNEMFKQAGYIEKTEYLATLKSLKKNPKKLASDFISGDTKTESGPVQQASLDFLKKRFWQSLDIRQGGFVFGQKYVEFDTYEYAFNHSKDDSLRLWVKNSMENSAGLYDKEWGGIYQYSTDNDWQHIHYEKLLFIQARYIKMYSWYYKMYGDKTALQRAEGITTYVSRFLSSPTGTFYNAQDADLIKGEKAVEYYKLNNEDRLKKGIPAIDSNVYTSDNAQYAEALLILWGATAEQKYLDQSLKSLDFLLANRKKAGMFTHASAYSSTTSLKDNLWMIRALMMAYRATQRDNYKTEAKQLLANIFQTFYSGKGYYYTYIGKSAIKSPYNISDNIDMCRQLNLLSYLFHDEKYKARANEVLAFLTNEKLMKTLSTEPGILTAAEELKEEPTVAALMQKEDNRLEKPYLREVTAFPHYYFNGSVYGKTNVPEDKKDLFNSIDGSFMVLCTSSYCSSPMYTIKELSGFLYKRVLNK